MEAASQMEKIIIISELGFKNCMVCASLAGLLSFNFKVKVYFIPEHHLTSVPNFIGPCCLVVGIGYKNTLRAKEKMITVIKKLILLTPTNGKKKKEFDSYYFYRQLDESYFNLIDAIAETANKRARLITKASNTGYTGDPDNDQEVIKFVSTEYGATAYLFNRYSYALKIIQTLDDEIEEIHFNENFLFELLDKEVGKIDEILEKYYSLEKETLQIINNLNPYDSGFDNIAYTTSDNLNFFEEDVFDAAEKLKYPIVLIECRKKDGELITIYSEIGSARSFRFPGKIIDNLKNVLQKFN